MVRLTPRGGRNEVVGWAGDALQVRVTAPPVDGRANEALCRLLASALDIAPSRVSIISGGTARMKRVRIEGLERDEVQQRLT